MNNNKNKIVIICLIIFIVIFTVFLNKTKKTSQTATTPEQTLISFVVDGKKQSMIDTQTLSLANGKTFYFGMPTYYDSEIGAVANCGSGGCSYNIYVGDNLKNMKRIIGFGKFHLNCDTNKISFEKDIDGEVFGFPSVDKISRIISVYEHLSVNLGWKNIYHIDDNGSPALIASYDNTCSDKVITLFRDSYFPKDLTSF